MTAKMTSRSDNGLQRPPAGAADGYSVGMNALDNEPLVTDAAMAKRIVEDAIHLWPGALSSTSLEMAIDLTTMYAPLTEAEWREIAYLRGTRHARLGTWARCETVARRLWGREWGEPAKALLALDLAAGHPLGEKYGRGLVPRIAGRASDQRERHGAC